MEYKVLENLVTIKLKNFIAEYENACQLFENEDVKNGLLHPGEYGMYKERLLSSLFEFSLPKKYSCGTGFITNSQKEITSQCDIILYDAANAPFLEVDSGRFFPQEVVYAIGEIKSKLTKQQLFDALIKLAKNKQIRKPFQGLTINNESVNVDPMNHPYDGICTFLICDEIVGWNDNIALEIQEQYVKNGIEKPFQFNLILSLKNGLIGYDAYKVFEYRKTKGELLEDWDDGHLSCASPFFVKGSGKQIEYLDYATTCKLDKIFYLRKFIVILNDFLFHIKTYYADPIHYIW